MQSDVTQEDVSNYFELQGDEYVSTMDLYDPDLLSMVFPLGLHLLVILLGLTALEAGLGRNLRKGFLEILHRNALVLVVGAGVYMLVGFDLMYYGDWPPFSEGTWWLTELSRIGKNDSDALGYGGAPMHYSVWLDVLFQSLMAVNAAILFSAVISQYCSLRMTLLAATAFCLITYPVAGILQWGGGFLSEHGFRDFVGAYQICLLVGSAALGWQFVQPRQQPLAPPTSGKGGRAVYLAIAALFWAVPLPLFVVGIAGVAAGLAPAVLAMIVVVVVGGILGLLLPPRRVMWAIAVAFLANAAARMASDSFMPGLSLIYLAIAASVLAVLVDWTLRRAGYRDPIGAVAGFGVGGLVGLIATGLFLEEGMDGGLRIQIVGAVICILWGMGNGAVLSVIHRVLSRSGKGWDAT